MRRNKFNGFQVFDVGHYYINAEEEELEYRTVMKIIGVTHDSYIYRTIFGRGSSNNVFGKNSLKAGWYWTDLGEIEPTKKAVQVLFGVK